MEAIKTGKLQFDLKYIKDNVVRWAKFFELNNFIVISIF